MMNYDISIVESIIRTPEHRIRQALHWYARQPLELQIEAHKLAGDLFYQYREKFPDTKNELRHAVFTLAVLKMYHSSHTIAEKNPEHDLREIRKTTELHINRFLAEKRAKARRKTAKRKEQVLRIWPEIEMLRARGFSWRDVAEFIQKHRRIKIHWTYIQKLAKETFSPNGPKEIEK